MIRIWILGIFILFSFMQEITQAKSKDINCSTKYSKSNRKLIIKHFKVGQNNFIKADLLKKILIGEWEISTEEAVTFNKNGSFKVYPFDKKRIDYIGEWKTKDNKILFKLKNSKNWTEVLIKKLILYESKKSSLRYNFEICLEKVKYKYVKNSGGTQEGVFLGGYLFISFNNK